MKCLISSFSFLSHKAGVTDLPADAAKYHYSLHQVQTCLGRAEKACGIGWRVGVYERAWELKRERARQREYCRVAASLLLTQGSWTDGPIGRKDSELAHCCLWVSGSLWRRTSLQNASVLPAHITSCACVRTRDPEALRYPHLSNKRTLPRLQTRHRHVPSFRVSYLLLQKPLQCSALATHIQYTKKPWSTAFLLNYL